LATRATSLQQLREAAANVNIRRQILTGFFCPVRCQYWHSFRQASTNTH